MSWDKLTWKQPRKFAPPVMEDGAVKETVLIGPDGPLKSNDIQIKIFVLKADTKVPRHSEDAIEMIQVLQGNEISIGFAVDDWLVRAKYHYFPATFPKVLKVNIYLSYLNYQNENIFGQRLKLMVYIIAY